MAIGQPWSQSGCPIATVNHQPCCTNTELQRVLRQVLSGTLTPVNIAIHDPAAQRVFLSLAVYPPEDLLPQGVGSLVGSMDQGPSQGTAMAGPGNVGISLAITRVINDSHSATARVIGGAVLFAIHQGYSNVSFATTQAVSHPGEKPGAVLIGMQA